MGKLKILLTGGGRGIGASIASDLAKNGHTVAICARSEHEVKKVAEKAKLLPGRIIPFTCDITNQSAVTEMVREATKMVGNIDTLINNAAIAGPLNPLESVNLDYWKQTIDVNLIGTVNCSRALIPLMKENDGGRIINFLGAGVGWNIFQPGKTAYITSKFAVYGLTESLASELERYNIGVSALSPGTADTVLRKSLNPNHPMESEDSTYQVIDMINFLLSQPPLNFTGKMLSARWDTIKELEKKANQLHGSNSLTLRKVDDRNYFERL